MSPFFEDGSKITYPEADRIVEEYVDERGAQRPRTTSRDVLDWADVPDTPHNQRRVHDALTRLCEPLDVNWAGRTVFRLTADNKDR